MADERNEPSYNRRMLRAEKITEGPIGQGTRFGAAVRSRRRPLDMVIEVTCYERPRRLSSTTSVSAAEIDGTLIFEPHAAGTQMRWSWDVRPKGLLKLLAPLVARLGRRQELEVWTSLKARLEAPAVGRPARADQSGGPAEDRRE